MTMRLLAGAAFLALATGAAAQSSPIARITDEGMNRSQIMTTAHELTDGIGPRLTNSPGMRRAEDWSLGKFRSFGLTARREGFEFGRGWEVVDSSARMVTPRVHRLTAIPLAWSPGTQGVVSAPIVVAPMGKAAHLGAWRGKLRGKIVLITLPRTGPDPTGPGFERLDGGAIGKLDTYRQPTEDPAAVERILNYLRFDAELESFLASEGALAMVRMSRREGLLLDGSAYAFQTGKSRKLPAFEIAAEDYRRLARLAKTGVAPTLELSSQVRFDDRDSKAYNVIADLAGTDPKAGYVMAGAHLDSWTAADGATDNAAGSAVVIEAARILATLPRPKRTIRFALWSGEEQGLIGSIAYVEQHLARRQMAPANGIEAYFRWQGAYPIQPLAGWNQLKAYFNMDNGSGKLRGIYAEGNSAAAPLLGEWLAPFASMGAGAVVADRTGSTDHVAFQAVAVPGYQFIQDPLDYDARTHHTSADTFDRLRAEDLRQAAVVMAGVLWQAANSDRELPRPPLPTRPTITDPFKYEDPDQPLAG